MAMNHAEAREMVLVAEESRRVLAVAYYRRLYPKVARARDLVASGAIGRPVLAEISLHDWFNDEDGRRPWLLNPRLAGGGPLYDVGSHRIDVLNFLFGTPLRVAAQMSNVVHQTEVEDSATVLVDYECGVRGIVDVRWHSRCTRDAFRITGTEGEIEMTPLNGAGLVCNGMAEELAPHSNLHYPCIENFACAVLDGAPAAASGTSAAWTDWVIERAVQAARR
jgi:predicted dehydrogenase